MIGSGQVWIDVLCKQKGCVGETYDIIMTLNNCWDGKADICAAPK